MYLLVPPGVNPIAVNKYIKISWSLHELSRETFTFTLSVCQPNTHENLNSHDISANTTYLRVMQYIIHIPGARVSTDVYQYRHTQQIRNILPNINTEVCMTQERPRRLLRNK